MLLKTAHLQPEEQLSLLYVACRIMSCNPTLEAGEVEQRLSGFVAFVFSIK